MIGRNVGHYRLEEKLGQGAFGTVYRGVHQHLDDIRVAVKVFHSDLSGDDAFVGMLRRECMVLHGLSHPGIVAFRDLVVEQETTAIVLELLEGTDLLAVLAQRGAQSPDVVVRLLEGILEPLAYGHERSVVHRDIKPGNVFLCADGAVKLMDFGIAKAAHTTRATKSGMIAGTLNYMSAERFEGESPPCADVYAAGLVGWELLVGHPACPKGDTGSKIRWHLQGGAPDVRESRPDCPAWLAELLLRMTAVDDQRRPRDAGEALQLLREARGGESGAEEASTWTSVHRGDEPAFTRFVPGETPVTATGARQPPKELQPAVTEGALPMQEPKVVPEPVPVTPAPARESRRRAARPDHAPPPRPRKDRRWVGLLLLVAAVVAAVLLYLRVAGEDPAVPETTPVASPVPAPDPPEVVEEEPTPSAAPTPKPRRASAPASSSSSVQSSSSAPAEETFSCQAQGIRLPGRATDADRGLVVRSCSDAVATLSHNCARTHGVGLAASQLELSVKVSGRRLARARASGSSADMAACVQLGVENGGLAPLGELEAGGTYRWQCGCAGSSAEE